jgi:hypothetical protein
MSYKFDLVVRKSRAARDFIHEHLEIPGLRRQLVEKKAAARMHLIGGAFVTLVLT